MGEGEGDVDADEGIEDTGALTTASSREAAFSLDATIILF